MAKRNNTISIKMKKILFITFIFCAGLYNYAQESMMYLEEQFANVRGVSTSLDDKPKTVSDNITKEEASILLGENMAFIGEITTKVDISYDNSIKGINNFTKKQQEDITSFEWAKKYPKATEYLRAQPQFWFSYMAWLVGESESKPLLEREPYYWEIENYLNNKFVTYKNFYTQKNKGK